jgi:hypothetical protein
MEKLAKYRQIVRELLIAHATPNEPNIECQLIFDTEHDHYQILDIGWQEFNRIYACYIHLDIKQNLRIDKLNKKCIEMNQQKTGDR